MAAALREGYRLLDSAVNYENEGAVGRAMRSSGVPREEVRVTSKLPGRHHRKPAAIIAIEETRLYGAAPARTVSSYNMKNPQLAYMEGGDE